MKFRLALLVAVLVIGPAAIAFADEVAIPDLVTESASYDVSLVGEIAVDGEMVGDFQRRGAYVWVQLNGDAYAERALLDGGEHAGANVGVGARFPTDLFDSLGVGTPGGYRVRGAVVAVTGAWHHHDEGRGGESWFEVMTATVVSPEHHLDEPIDWAVMTAGAALLVIAGAITLATRRRPRREI